MRKMLISFFAVILTAKSVESLQSKVWDQSPDPILSVNPKTIFGKVDQNLKLTVSLVNSGQIKTPIKIFWETSGFYITPEADKRNLFLSDENEFNANITISSSLLGIYSIKFFRLNERNEKVYFNNASEISLVVEGEHKQTKTSFAITLSVLVSIALFFMGMGVDLDIVKKTLKRPIGCSPGGANSNLWTSMFGGDIDLSVTMTFISTVFSFAMTTFWIYFLGTPLVEKHIQIPYIQISVALGSLFIPVSLGVIFKRYQPQKAEIVKKYVSKPFFLLILIIVPTFACYANRFVFYLMTWRHIVCGILLGSLGYTFGAGMAVLSCQKLPQIIAISMETAMQNAAVSYVALTLALKSPYNDIARLPMIAFIMLSTGPMVFVLYAIHFIGNKLRQTTQGWKKVTKEETPNGTEEEADLKDEENTV